MSEPFLGQIIAVGFSFAPTGWFLCNGKLLPIDQYEALFQLLGTTYGGNGTTTFGLPNLNGRVPVGVGQGRGLSTYVPGEVMGSENVTLTSANTPAHAHTIAFSAAAATVASPKSTDPAKPLAVGANSQTALKNGMYLTPASGVRANVALRKGMIKPVIGGQPHENRQPYTVLNYIIAYAGIYPSQN